MNEAASSGRAIRRTNMVNLFRSVIFFATHAPVLAGTIAWLGPYWRSPVSAPGNSRGIIWQMRRDHPLPPWPGLRETWWVFGSAVAILGLYSAGFVLRIRCRFVGHCGGTASRLFGLDAVGGLPRLAVTVL